MNIAIDCDEVILDTTPAVREFYISLHPDTFIPENEYSGNWTVFGPDAAAHAANWRAFIDDFANTENFARIPPLPGAVEYIRQLKRDGHRIFVLSSISNDAAVCDRRAAYLEKTIGPGVIDRVVCITLATSKKEELRRNNADILIDDTIRNIDDAIDMGIHAILFKCKENAKIIRAMQCGETQKFPHAFFQQFDSAKVCTNALIADGWPSVVEIVRSIKN
ncbi:MAG: hypothetical protein FWC51_03645 [Proteobacteria bacterium]|nr:hypothetical protein [Pseudomonadota bacterium]